MTAPEEQRDRAVERRSVLESVVTLVLLFGFYILVPLDGERWPWGMALGLVAVAAVVPLTVHRLRRIRSAAQPLAEAVRALVLLLGLALVGFATTFYGLASHSDQIPGIETKIDALYFATTTAATVGFGDIVPVGQGARLLVTIQIIANLVLVGTAVRLISNLASRRHFEQDASSGTPDESRA